MPGIHAPCLTLRDRGRAALPLAIAMFLLAGCITPGVQVDRGPLPIPVGPPGWDVQTREHLDLWLHGYALLQPDSSTLPFFRPAYRSELLELREQEGIFTLLDANMDRLAPHLRSNPDLVNGQFAPLYFPSWAELRDGVQAFLRANGNPSRAGSGSRRAVTILAQMYPTADDREWLRTFALSLEDERERFYQAHWEDRQRQAVLAYASADSALRSANGVLRRYTASAALDRGTVLLSLPLGGEGRSVLRGLERALVAVPRPLEPDDASSAVYVFVHEIVSPAVDVATREFTGELPMGLTADAYITSSLVRAGHHLLTRADPGLAEGYARYYLELAGRQAGRDPGAGLAAAFPLPSNLQAAVFSQVDEVWAGI